MTSHITPEEKSIDTSEPASPQQPVIAVDDGTTLRATERAPLSDTHFRLLALGLVAVAVLVTYSNALTAGFVWDDFSSVLLHKHVQDPSQFSQLFREDFHAFGRGQGNFYRPLQAASYMLDYAVARTASTGVVSAAGVPDISPFIFHLGNVFWHFLACAMLFGVLVRLNAPRAVSVAVAILYAVHPLHTEAVTYISGRADSMASAFVLLALFCALMEGSLRRRLVGAGLSLVFFAAALLSKESATIFPFLLLLFVAVLPMAEGRSERKAVYMRHALPMGLSVLAVIAYAVLRWRVLNFAEPEAASTTGVGARLMETGQAFALYFKLIVVPTGLHMERTLEGVASWVGILGYGLLLGCVAVIVWALKRGHFRIVLGMGWFLIAWFPISGIIPINAPMAEHWMYVPLAGLLWAVAELIWLGLPAPAPRRVAAVVVYAACVALIGLSIDRNRDWHDDESLYRATLAKNPNSVRVQYNLAVAYEVLLDNPVGARRHFEEVLRLYQARRDEGDQSVWDEELESRLSLGNIYYDRKSYEQARQNFTAVLQVQTDQAHQAYLAKAAFGLGKTYLAMGDVQGALQLFERAVQVLPELRPQIGELLQGTSMMGMA